MSDLSWLNPTPHAIAVYASQPTSPLTTQHSLPSGRYSLLGPDFHRLDRTSFAWRTHSITSSARTSAEIVSEFVRLKVDVIVSTSIGVPTFKQATEVIPIVFALGTDPLGGGVIASLARPGGNVTGLSTLSTDIASKRLELLREAVPGIRRLAVFANAGN